MPSTTSYLPGDLVLVDFPFTTGGPGKPRPALVVLDTGDADVVLARVTTQPKSTPLWNRVGMKGVANTGGKNHE